MDAGITAGNVIPVDRLKGNPYKTVRVRIPQRMNIERPTSNVEWEKMKKQRNQLVPERKS